MIPLLQQLVLAAGVGVLAAMVLGRLRLPSVAGFIVAGVVVGPHGLTLIGGGDRIHLLADIGVALLLFTIGLELSVMRLAHLGRLVVVGGTLQVGLTVAAAAIAAWAAGAGAARGVFFGFLVALSSTAIVLKALQDRRELDAPHGQAALGVLLFQDLAVAPMLAIVPVLAGASGGGRAGAVTLALGKAVLVVVAALLGARVLVPRFLALVDRAQSREVFLLAVLLVCSATAWLSAAAGLPVALGAFLAGMVVADSDYAHRALSEVLPLRALFTSVFFVSVGLLFDPGLVTSRPVAVALWGAVLLLGKAVIALLAALALQLPLRVAVMAALALAQFGEFGFVLLRQGEEAGLIGAHDSGPLFAAAVLSMVAAPLVMAAAPHVALRAPGWRGLAGRWGAGSAEPAAAPLRHLSHHVVVVGYGVSGQILARALQASDVPYVVVDLSSETVRRARKEGERILYGDIGTEEALAHAGVTRARALVLLINDAAAAERAVAAARRHAPGLPIFVRVRYLGSAAHLTELGATAVIADEVEAGVEALARALLVLGVPRNVLAERVRQARDATASSERGFKLPRRRLGDMAELDELRLESFLVREGMFGAGKSAVDLNLRRRTGALVVTGRRQGKLLPHPDPHDAFAPGDVVYLLGPGEALVRAFELLEHGTVEEKGSDPFSAGKGV
jgi:CPA2 family monovalent cation:H+ antiporter-2